MNKIFLNIRFSPFFKKTVFCRLHELFFAVFIFAAACTNSTPKHKTFTESLNTDELSDLSCFVNFLMFENYGAFVLFGSKPLCCLSLGDPDSSAAQLAFDNWFSFLPEEEKVKIEKLRAKALKDPLHPHCLDLRKQHYKGWIIFQKWMKQNKSQKFLLRVVPLRCPDAYNLVFMNVRQVALVLSENYDIFKQAAGMDFNPSEIVWEAQNPDSVFWENVFSGENHLAKGLLYGFGLKNALAGSQEFDDRAPKADPDSTTPTTVSAHLNIPYGSASVLNFNIPIFGKVAGDDTVERYEQEKEAIQAFYGSSDILGKTLQALADL